MPPPPDPSAKLSSPSHPRRRPPPPSRLSHGLRGAGLGFFWDQIIPAWAGQTRPLGYNATQKPPMNFFRGSYGWRCTRQNGMSKPTPFPMDCFLRVGNWEPQFSSPISPGLWGAGCSWDWLSSELGGPAQLAGLGVLPEIRFSPSLAFRCSQSPCILHPSIPRAPTFPEPPPASPAMS